MAAALFWWRATWRRSWRPTVTVVLVCGVLGAVALAALAGARRTESAYGRYLAAIRASDVSVNIPQPGTSVIAKVSRLPGIRSSAAWVGLAAVPIIHGRPDTSFMVEGLHGSVNGEFFTQDTMSVVAGRLPRLSATHEIALTSGMARVFGVGVGGTVTYAYVNQEPAVPVVTAHESYRVVGIVDVPPVLVDQFDQVSAAVLPPGATAVALHFTNSVVFSWVGIRLTRGDAGIPAFQGELSGLSARLGGQLVFNLRRYGTVHQQVQESIEPQAIALGVFGGLVSLAVLVLAGQALSQLLDRSARQLEFLRALGMTRSEAALAGGIGGTLAVVAGMVIAVAGAVALSPLAPVGSVRQFDPARGVEVDATVLLGGGLVLTVLLVGLSGWRAWRSLRPTLGGAGAPPSSIGRLAMTVGLPATAVLGIRSALEPPPGGRRSTVRANVVGSVVAVAAVITAVIFGASLNGLVSHPTRYGWNWNVLIQAQGGYGDWYGYNMSKLMAAQPGVEGWSTFAFTQLSIDGTPIPILGLATHGQPVEPPTISGHSLSGADDIELGQITLRQLGKQVGDRVTVGTGHTARRMTIVGTVTLPSVGVQLADHVSLGRGAMLPESTLLSIVNFNPKQSASDLGESITALPSTLAIDLRPGARAGPVVDRILAADPDGDPGAMYQVHRVLAAAVENDAQMGDQPLTLAVVLAVAMMFSVFATVQSSTHRRRRDLAVMKSLGLTRRQVRSIVAWHTTTLLVIAAALGLALGWASGRLVWAGFAGSIGVGPQAAIPVGELILGLVALVVIGNALTALPAVLAARSPAAGVLRTE